MFSLDLECTQATHDLLIAELYEAGSVGITELSDTSLRAFFDDEQSAEASGLRFGVTPQPADTTDWVTEAQQSLQPTLVGERFFLVPEWRNDPTPEGRFRIQVNNGLAFGTGKHETTRLCLMLLETYVKPGMTVVDIGTGTGILCEAALLLGAAKVYACDIDHTAVEIAEAHGIPAFTGSADAIRSHLADVLVANISPEALTALRNELPRILKPGGTAILSGLELPDEVPFTATEVHTEGNWKALIVPY
jgi:ribosomal protein L11 methyltransferase